ncbi:lasso RiPP family leader peptide-containing protein [Streptomyces sp. NPDC046261]
MEEQTGIYEPPALAEIGGFAELTLDKGTWGWDRINQCSWLAC